MDMLLDVDKPKKVVSNTSKRQTFTLKSKLLLFL